jgi:hypothetical protein
MFRSSLEVREEGIDLTISALELSDEGDYRYCKIKLEFYVNYF